jgi:hypothetical protein
VGRKVPQKSANEVVGASIPASIGLNSATNGSVS